MMALDSYDEFQPSAIHFLGPAFQLRIVVFSNLIPALRPGDALVNHQPRYRRNRETSMNNKNTSIIVATSAFIGRFVRGYPVGGGRGEAYVGGMELKITSLILAWHSFLRAGLVKKTRRNRSHSI